MKDRSPSTKPEFLSVKEVCKLTGLSRASIWRLRKSGNFPQAVELTAGRIAFVAKEIYRWVEARIAARNAPIT